MTKHQQMQAFIRHYLQTTGKTEIDMKDVAAAAIKMGWVLPEPKTPEEVLAHEFSRAARELTERDGKTGRPYRVYHAIAQGQGTFWVEINSAPRKHMAKAVTQRREQSVGDIYQAVLDLDHWNRVHPGEQPIPFETDFTMDIELRKNVQEDEQSG